MNKGELINEVAKVACSKKEAELVVKSVLDTIGKELKKKKEVALIGFGTFRAAKRKARIGKNPQTGEKLKIPAKWVPVFKAGKALKELVR
ncbi:MAG: HU family DNA-binding protein [Candidatus Omnitrophica bacterium]|nr:HU family DNA-binding protein [Candidatus Omnitrophota bacterium]MBU1134338.1 HU family DNA-binding protein [Candidatus Omnitrophota bacterium]MBU1366654.1 HU family DNA-binding protein [Candidatus Omnitrophota bacterium]MBU1523490.1 HU family DNA-binding protein [Candidatus Omnitrophota bacterium]MBU1810852.1 HU family DNA-binding protein [Candidatus Omnitrophota bacterium]